MLVCGVCGRRLGVRYTGNGGIYPIYQCIWRHREALAPKACLSVPASPLDQAIAERLVCAITPVTIELALAALTSLEQRDHEIGAQWRMRIERARYEADLAERRYEAVDPANRLIAATLEQRWNDAMQRLQELEAEFAAFERQTMRTVTAEQKRQILQLAGDFPNLWAASTTTGRDRKRILRLLVRDITVTKGSEPKIVRLQICWQGGATETLELQLPPNRAEAVRYPETFVTRIRELAINQHDGDIIRLLHAEGHRSSTGKSLTPSMIKWLRYKYRIPAPRPADNTLNVRQVRDRYGVSLGSFTIGSAVDLSLRISASQTRRTQYRSMTNPTSSCELGSLIPYTYARHPKRTLHEVHYACHVGMPRSRVPPAGFGICTRRTGCG